MDITPQRAIKEEDKKKRNERKMKKNLLSSMDYKIISIYQSGLPIPKSFSKKKNKNKFTCL